MAKKLLSLIFALLFVGIGLTAGVRTGVAQDAKTFEWQRLDVDINVQQNGDLRIIEKNVIRFTSGRFTFGFRDIERERLTDINDIVVTEGSELGRKIRFETATSESGAFRIKYFFGTPAENEVRTITLAYTISGALRYYDAGDQVWWAAVYSNRNGFPVRRSLVTVTLPGGATAQKAETYGTTAKITAEAGEQVLTFEADGPIPSGTEFGVRVQFPHGIVQGQPAPWQKAFDEQQAYDENVRPRNNLLALLAGLLASIGGPVAALVLWVTKGRDPNVGLVAEYLTEPPNIGPGVAGTLVDETADMQDIVATLVDLARRGHISMQETKPAEHWGAQDYLIATGPNYGTEKLQPHESALIEAMALPPGADGKLLSAMKNKIFKHIGPIKKKLYAQMVQDAYYNQDPETTRNKWSSVGFSLLVIAFIVGCGSVVALMSLTNYAICIPVGLVATAIMFLIIARNMPQRTRSGADMRMRAEAFKRYLQNIEKYTDLKTATDLFDKYLPYAVAFGIDRSWVRKFSSVPTPVPPWYGPYGYPSPYGHVYSTGSAGGGGRGRGVGDVVKAERGDVSGAARAPASGTGLDALNTGMAAGLASINTNLTTMFQSAANTFSSQPAPVQVASTGSSWSSSRSGSSGWSGGGSSTSSRGSSGGGGGGFG